MDQHIYKIDLESNKQYLNMDGNLVDKRTQMAVEAQSGIELAEQKIEHQGVELSRLKSEGQLLEQTVKSELDKQMKLKTIAT